MRLISFPVASSIALSVLVFLCSGLSILAQTTNSSSPLVPAVIAFGDSIIDPGNNNVIMTLIKCNFPPYGVDFVDHKPTGRFCNGKIPTDFIASKMGVKEFLPAYLGTNLSPQDLLTGVSFASGGTGYDPLTPKLASVISLTEQLELFKEYLQQIRAIAGEKKAANIVAESLYVVCVGSDDVANTYFTTPLRKTEYDFSSYANLMLNSASRFYEELIQIGARRIGVVGIPPIGCVPSQRTLSGGILRGCAPGHNQIAKLFNAELIIELQRLRAKYQGVKLVYVDIYAILGDIMQHPTNYGFEVSTRGCCGTGNLEVSVLCNSATSSICADVSKYVFWDSYHPTERAYEILVDEIIEKYLPLLL